MPERPPQPLVVLVSGATRGIGRAVALALARRGERVVATGRDPAALDQLARDARPRGWPLEVDRLDVTDAASVRRAVGAAVRRHGRIDVLVNNAAIAHAGGGPGLEQTPPEALLAVLDTNLAGALRLAQAVLPAMRARRWGRIVNVSSQRGQLGVDFADAADGAYRISKAALNMMTKLLAAELRGTGILVNAVCPGWVPTRLGGPGATGTMDDAVASITWAIDLPDDGPSGGFFHCGRPLPW